MSVTASALQAIYANGDDPWHFATSPYEQEKFRATRAALSHDRYEAALELGCGNGALARHLAPLCNSYTGLDAVETALLAAQSALPQGRFIQGFLPCALPTTRFDLIVLSEILYFLDADEITDLARDIEGRWPRAELLCVSYLGNTSHALSGEQSLACFTAAMPPRRFTLLRRTQGYRIDRATGADHA